MSDQRLTGHCAVQVTGRRPQIQGQHQQEQQIHFHAGGGLVGEGRAAVVGGTESSAVSSPDDFCRRRSWISTGTDLANRTLIAVVCVAASGLPFEHPRGLWGSSRERSFIGCGRL
jgi:hypothetical protein